MSSVPATAQLHRISAHDLADQLATKGVTVIDVREPMEYASGHINGNLNIPLARIAKVVCPPGNRPVSRCASSRGHPCP
jgi:rhodanese-related sulfurtransferase